MNKQEQFKKKAAIEAVNYIESGMRLGLGTGSTVFYALEEIGKRLKSGKLKNIAGIPSSKKTEELAKKFRINLISFGNVKELDLNIDGADEVDGKMNLIKGGGGALLREKVLAQYSKRNIIIIDESKLSENLGEKWHVPVEVIPFAKDAVTNQIKKLKGAPVIRRNDSGKIFKTDQGNVILDCDFGVIRNPTLLERKLNMIAGVVENGIFNSLVEIVIVAGTNGIRNLK